MPDFDIQRTPVEVSRVSGNRKRAQYALEAGDVFEIAVLVNGEIRNTLRWTATAQPDSTPKADVRVTVIDNVPEG